MKEKANLTYDAFKLYSDSFYKYFVETSDLSYGFFTAIATILLSILMAVMYYRIIDNPSWAKKKVWGIIMVVNALIIGVLGYFIADYQTYEYAQNNSLNPPEISDLFFFGLTAFVFGAATFIIASFLIKGKSNTTSHIPYSIK